MITLIIKCEPDEAAALAGTYDVELNAVEPEATPYGGTIATCDYRFISQVSNWFCLPGDAPFSKGTLLWYAIR